MKTSYFQFRFFLVTAFISLLASVCLAQPDVKVDEAVADSVECSKFLTELKKISHTSPDLTASYIVVPENWAQPTERKIRVLIYTTGYKAGRPLVVFFNGGPGESSHSSSLRILKENVLPQRINMVFIDQRGTGCSAPYPDGSAAEVARLQHYTSQAMIKDAEYARKNLFKGEKWSVLGQSYGGFIAYRYAIEAPGGVRSFHVHGFVTGKSDYDILKERMRSEYEVLGLYLKTYPEDEKRLQALWKLLVPGFCYPKATQFVICGKAMLSHFADTLAFHDQWMPLHEFFSLLVSNTGEVDQQKLRDYVEQSFFRRSPKLNFGPVAVTYIEMGLPAGNAVDKCAEILESLKGSIDLNRFYLNSCMLETGFRVLSATQGIEKWYWTEIGKLIRHPISVAEFTEARKRSQQIPFYVYSGGLDCLVPPSLFVDQSRQLQDLLTYRNFSSSGHEGFLTEKQVLNDILSAWPQASRQ